MTLFENQKGSRTAACKNVEPLTISDVEFKRKECITVTQTLQDCSSTSHIASDETYLATSYNHISDSDATSYNSSSSTCTEEILFHNTFWPTQNRFSYTNLAIACDRYQISDRAGAAIATSTLNDYGLIDEDD